MIIYTKESLIESLREIRKRGWIPSARHGNAGGVGNTLEDLLGIAENNLPIPNAAEWELKCQRSKTKSLITLFHLEPSPQALRFVPQVFLPKYGWPHKEAGKRHPAAETSFRQTISAFGPSDRGFKVVVDEVEKKVVISFNATVVGERHSGWLNLVNSKAGLSELNPQPYWGFEDLRCKARSKLHNCFLVRADVKREQGREFFNYSSALMLQEFSLEGLLRGLKEGFVFVDFDARSGHNHGTKFRLRQDKIPELNGTYFARSD